MADLQEVKDTIAAEHTEVQGKLGALATEIQALKDQMASGNPVTAADLDGLKASVQGISEA